MPNHVVLVPDGDRRWARARGLKPQEGHKAGIQNMADLAQKARGWGIHTVTAWGLSTENWLDRPQEETEYLMKGIAGAIDYYFEQMKKDGVKLVHLGRKDRLPRSIMDRVEKVERETRNNTKHIFNLGLDYNGPDEIVRAIRKILAAGIQPDKVDRKLVDSYMDNSDQPYPYPDMIIRTSGEQRTSGILQWQSDYAELYFELDHFPDFTPEKLRAAILDYSLRRRRFGGNDAGEHMEFDPKSVARLEMEWQGALRAHKPARLLGKVIEYVREHYGLEKEAAKAAGAQMVRALMSGQQEDWETAGEALERLYEVIKKHLGLAFDPNVIAKIEINLWKEGATEDRLRQLVAEKFRVSNFQASKSAHLAYLANVEMGKKNWEKARGLMEKFYQALKERVA